MRAMLRKMVKYSLGAAATLFILVIGFIVGFSAAAQQAPAEATTPISTSTPDMAVFWEAWELIEDTYLQSGDISDEDKVRGATAGLVMSLNDPYSEYFSPQDAESFRENVSGNFGGIGAQLGIRDDALTVISPLKGSPAEKAGLMAGDRILFVDATSTEAISIEQAVNIIRGVVGTPVELTIIREGWDEPREFRIVRDEINLPTLDSSVEDGIAHVQLYQFNANAEQMFLDAIREAALQRTRGVILDLRGNPGGFLDVAVDLAGWFLPRGTVVVTQEGREGAEKVLRANGNAALERIPVVVLIDEGSASASEILAGALRDHRQIPLVGQKSFGKGTVQELQNLQDGSLLKLTVAHWVLPSGHILEKNGGLTPDHEVELTEEDIEDGRDPQLDKAREVLREILAR